MTLAMLSVPAHFSQEHLDGLRGLVGATSGGRITVESVYGSMPFGEVGHTRDPRRIPVVERDSAVAYIQSVKQLRVRFNYVMNATWSRGKEHNLEGQARIRTELEYWNTAGIDSVILGNPLIIALVRGWFPRLPIVASINLRASTVHGVARLLELGADVVVLDRRVNRDFPFLAEITRRFPGQVEVLTNSTCIPECPFQDHHSLQCSWLSCRDCSVTPEPNTDEQACFNYCAEQLLLDPALILRCTWIRPEDLNHYIDAGVTRFKIQGRSLVPTTQLQLARWYLEQRMPREDLLSLFPGLLETLRDRAQEQSRIPPRRIPTEALDRSQFLRPFIEGRKDCRLGCERCRYCDRVLAEIS